MFRDQRNAHVADIEIVVALIHCSERCTNVHKFPFLECSPDTGNRRVPCVDRKDHEPLFKLAALMWVERKWTVFRSRS
jgi:hypothetical protein